MSLSPSLAPSLLIDQLRLLEAQIPVRLFLLQMHSFTLTQKQPLGFKVPPTDTVDQVTIANQILTTARQLRETLATESTEASQKLSQAILDIVAYSEQVENTGRLLSLADSCIGQIRSRMHAHGIPINIPSTTSNAITPLNAVTVPDTTTMPNTMPNMVPDINGPGVQG